MFAHQKSKGGLHGGGGNGPVAIPKEERLQLRSLGPTEQQQVPASNNTEGGQQPNKLNGYQAVAQTTPSSLAPETPTSSTYGQSLEYAAGEALRKNVLEPVIREYSYLEEDILVEAPRFLGMFAKGEIVLVGVVGGQASKVEPTTIHYVGSEDENPMVTWWQLDKVLSYTDEEWSGWWARRCHLFDPGCEMVKLTNRKGEILGVAYYERNIVDKNNYTGTRDRITLIRGIRLSPRINKEVIRRFNTAEKGEPSRGPEFSGVASALLCYIIFMSLRYGTTAVAVNCAKNEVAETFYQRFMGDPQTIETDTGRRHYRMDSENRWNVLRTEFRRQLDMLIQLQAEERQTEEKERMAVVNGVNQVAKTVATSASDLGNSMAATHGSTADDGTEKRPLDGNVEGTSLKHGNIVEV